MNRNSDSLDLVEVRQTDLQKDEVKESYKKLDLSEKNIENGLSGDTVKNSNMVSEKKTDIQDGADEKMLEENGTGDDCQQLTNKEVTVTFIPTVDHANGDAKIDMKMEPEKSFTGMTKDELMKYANDPFWVRLRWVLFVAFWMLWIGMLLGAVYIIIDAPKCSAPSPLIWYKEGPLVILPKDVENINQDYVDQVKQLGAKGVIYEVPGDDTYFLEKTQQKKIQDIVEKFKDVNVVVDLTPNYVMEADPWLQDFLENAEKQTAFAWRNTSNPAPTNWINRDNKPAWQLFQNVQIVSHYGEKRYDLNMSSTLAKEKLKGALQQLISWGVKGFRMNDAKHYIISGEFKPDVPKSNPDGVQGEYGFYTHSYNTFQPGLGALIHDLGKFVRNATGDLGFVSVNENLIDPAYFQLHANVLGVDIPQYGFLPKNLQKDTPIQLFNELKNIYTALPSSAWPQWVYNKETYTKLGGSEFNMFIMLLKGVPVAPLDAFAYDSDGLKFVAELVALRTTPCFMHGDLKTFTSANESSIGYTRFKSGNPGYFVALNPTEEEVTADFSSRDDLPDELTVSILSENYKKEDIKLKSKMPKDKVRLSPKSGIIFTYVPKN